MKRLNRKRGAALVYVAVAMTGLTGLTSLAVDVAHVRLVKQQLQCAADASSRAAARGLQYGTANAQSNAVAAARACAADGVPVAVDATQDIDIGLWANNSFTVLSGASLANANAVRVRCVHSAARGNPVAVFFGSLIGIASQDASAQAVAVGTPTLPAGFIGYNGVSAKNNAFFGSYQSSVTTTPTEKTASTAVRVGTNGAMTAKNNNEIYGDAILGPAANNSGFAIAGSTSFQTSALPIPNMPTWNPQPNPGGLPMDYVTGTTTTLPGGTYYFSSLNISGDLTFSGPTTIYVNGPIAMGGVLAPTSGIPGDLTIYQYGSNTFGENSSNGMDITARVFAPYTDLTAKNNLEFRGSGIFNTITLGHGPINNADFFYDASLGPADGSYKVTTTN